ETSAGTSCAESRVTVSCPMSLLLSTRERERNVNDAAVAPKLHWKAAPAEDCQHRLVIGKHLAVELRNAGLSRNPSEMLQNKRRDARATIGAVGHEGDFGRARLGIFHGVATATNQDFASG